MYFICFYHIEPYEKDWYSGTPGVSVSVCLIKYTGIDH